MPTENCPQENKHNCDAHPNNHRMPYVMSAHHKEISFNFLVWMTAQAIQHCLWVANPQRIYSFLFQCYCHGNWLNCRSRLHLYCLLTFILICRHYSGARKRQRTNQYCSLKHIVNPCVLHPPLCKCSHLHSVSPMARDLKPEDLLPAASFSTVTLLCQA